MTSGTGTCTVKYDQAGNGNYNAAPQVTETVTAQKAAQTINVTTHAPATAVFNTGFTVAATGGASGNAVTFSSSGACSNTGASFTMTSGTGTCSVKYDQAGNANYNAAPQVTETVTAQKADQTINVTTHAPASAAYNSASTVAATAPGGAGELLEQRLVHERRRHFTITSGTGICSVKYDQAGNANYNAAPQATETVNAQKANQTIIVTLHAPANAVYNTSFSVAADGGGSGNPVTFSSSGVCTNTGASFTMTSGTGTCTVKYDQAGDANYNAAPQVTESVTAQKASQTITFAPLPDRPTATRTSPSARRRAPASRSPSAPPASARSPATTVHLTGPGSCTITASQGGDTNYTAATDVPRTFQINAPAESAAEITDDAATCAQFAAGTAPVLSIVNYIDKKGVINKATPNLAVLLGQGHRAGRAAHGAGRPGDHVGQLQPEADPCHRRQGTHRRVREGEDPDVHERPRRVRDGRVQRDGRRDVPDCRPLPLERRRRSAAPAPTTIHYLFSTAGVSSSTATLDLLRQAPAHRRPRCARLLL